jgi:hypothetical protein
MLHAALLAVALAQPAPATPSPTPIASPSPSASIAPSPGPTSPAGTLILSPSSLALNPAQQRVVTVSGATAPLQATLDQRLVNVTVDASGGSVTITATQATGNDVLHLVDANGARADLPIRVAFNAGTIVPQTTLEITGNPVDPTWLTRQVTDWVTRLTQALPGAQTAIGSVTPPATPLLPGQSTQFVIPVQVAGNGQYFDQSGSTTVTVQNVAADPFAPGLLFYDDDPEHLTQDGVLFRGTVSAAQPVRLYYYHDDAQDPRRIVVALSSDSQDPTSVQLIDAAAGPNMDVMHVGHTSTLDFLLSKPRNEGVVVDLAQDQPFLLADIPMTARQGVAGTVDLRVLTGGPIIVTVLAVSPGVDPRTLLSAPPLPDDGHHRTGVFQIGTFGQDNVSFTVGGADATVVLGDADPTPPAADPNVSGHDYGDYGVLHTINVTLANPTDNQTTAYLYFKPLAGPARGSFLVDGNLVQLGCVRVSTPYQIATFELMPRQTYHVVVQTMTDGGSFYPAEIGATTTPPQPAAPQINAPDGCFPKPQAAQAPSE